MKLSVTGRYVDLDFETPTPIKLSQQFSTDSVAQAAARAIARKMGIKRFDIHSQGTSRIERLTKKQRR